MPEHAADNEPIKPIPEENELNGEKVALGRALFHDPRLSKDDSVACVSCHDLGSGGDDGRKVSVGVEGKTGPINAPTVFNVGFNFKQFWDGRAETLEEQIDGPVQSPVELGSLWPEVITKLHAHESYPQRFKALYPDGINRANVKNALAEFMSSLTTPNSRFDRWLKGERDALDSQEKRGYALFKHYGCSSCHQGANVGGNMFQVFGVLNDYFKRARPTSPMPTTVATTSPGIRPTVMPSRCPACAWPRSPPPICTTAPPQPCAMPSMPCSSTSSDAAHPTKTRKPSSPSSRPWPARTGSCSSECLPPARTASAASVPRAGSAR